MDNNLLKQRSIKSEISVSGVGLHTGKNVNMKILPAAPNTGIIFKRIDIRDRNNLVIANYKNVVDTKLGTVIANNDKVIVRTIEHFLAAIFSMKIDNLIIELDQDEVPVMDGSSSIFMFILESAGITIEEAQKKMVKVRREINLEIGDKYVRVVPANDFEVDLTIDFKNEFVGKQNLHFKLSQNLFKFEIARARTFAFKEDIEYLHKIGLGLGGSLDNAVVVDGNKILNENGLRYHDEFVRHKMLDFIGDMSLTGMVILGKFTAYKSGHDINNQIIHKIFSEAENWILIE